MRWIGRWTVTGATAVLVAGALVGCTAGGGGASSPSAADAAAPAYSAEAERAVGGGSGDAVATAAPTAPPAGAPAGVPVGGVERALVRTAEVSLVVADTRAALDRLRAAAAGAGGFVAEERSGGSSGYAVLRVPAAALDGLLDRVVALAEPGTPVERSAAVVDATEEVVDLDARVASQRASTERVRGLLTGAGSLGDVIALESELARREAELDSLTARLTALRDRVALSTLTVSLDGPDDPALATPDAPVGFLDGLAAGTEGLLALGRGAGALLGFLLPFVPVLAVAAAVLLAAVRRARRRRPAPPDPGPAAPPDRADEGGTPIGGAQDTRTSR